MMKVIYKYRIENSKLTELLLPKGTLVTGCMIQNDQDVSIYCLIDKDVKETELRSFKIYATGETIGHDIKEYIGHFIVNGYMVFHVVEVKQYDDKEACMVSMSTIRDIKDDGLVYYYMTDGECTLATGNVKMSDVFINRKVKITIEVLND